MSDVVLPNRTDGALWLLELLGECPETAFLSASRTGRAWPWMPAALEQSLNTQALNIARTLVLKPDDTLEALRAASALGWEVACIHQAIRDGETLDRRAGEVKSTLTGYPQYAKKQRLNERPLGAEHRLKLQNDVPIFRQTRRGPLPYVVECKHTRSHPQGQSFSAPPGSDHYVDVRALNQLLRYQAAIDNELIAGATLEIRGRVSPGLLRWALEGFDGQGSLVPGLEIIWNAPLPSGQTFRVQVKAGVDPGRWTPRGVVADVDQTAVAGLMACVNNPSLLWDVMRGGIALENVQDPERRALLMAPLELASGAQALPTEKPSEIRDVATWRAVLTESDEQVIARLEHIALQPSPPKTPGFR